MNAKAFSVSLVGLIPDVSVTWSNHAPTLKTSVLFQPALTIYNPTGSNSYAESEPG